MLLERDPSLAEAPGFTKEQLASLTAAVSAKQLKLEADINAYVAKKQAELTMYEQKLLAQYREMECTQTQPPPTTAVSPFPSLPPSSPSSSSPTLQISARPEDKEKRQKRVHKREKELSRLVPFFLPLLDAQSLPPSPPTKKGEERQESNSSMAHDIPRPAPPPDVEMGSPPCDVPSSKEHGSPMFKKTEEAEHSEHPSGDAAATEKRSTSDFVKKAKRPGAMKKSSLRNSNEKSRRKRVSLVIDDQIVLPADLVAEPSLTSPSDTAPSSASTSTTSLEEMIDPRLMSDADSPQREHQETMPDAFPISELPPRNSTNNPAIPTAEPSGIPHPVPPAVSSPTSPSSIRSPVTYEPPASAGRPFLERSPPKVVATRNVPQHASSAPIYASLPKRMETGEKDFSSYVGGIDGSGVDDLNQTGSLGFPSSLGASYMESYMQSRPLSVRMAAAEKAGLDEKDKAALLNGKARLDDEADNVDDVDMDVDNDRGEFDVHKRPLSEDEEMGIVGSMEEF